MTNRWVREVSPSPAATQDGGIQLPSIPQLEVTYLTDPDVIAALLPPPLEPMDEPRAHVRVTDIDIEFGAFKHRERVGYFAVDASYEGEAGEYPLVIPIDLESAIYISREMNGQPKELAEVALIREGSHVEGRVTRNGVTFVEIAGDLTDMLPNPAPFTQTQWWFKYSPAVEGDGFDAGPFLVRSDDDFQTESLQRVDGKLVLRELASDPVVDLPVREVVSMQLRNFSVVSRRKMVGPIDAEAFKPYAHQKYDRF